MIWLTVSRVHDFSRIGDQMIHILTLFWPVWPCHKVIKITLLLLFILSVREFHKLVHYSVIVGVI